MTQKTKSWLGLLFDKGTDFYQLLSEQATKNLQGLEALNSWLETGEQEQADRVRSLEKEADELKLKLEFKLVESFVTPIDREDIYDLSNCLDNIINAAKATVREVEALEVSIKAPLVCEMSGILVEGGRCLLNALNALKQKPGEVITQALLARKSENRFVKVYRQAMKEAFCLKDQIEILKTVELYRALMEIAEKIDFVGERLLHVMVKIT